MEYGVAFSCSLAPFKGILSDKGKDKRGVLPGITANRTTQRGQAEKSEGAPGKEQGGARACGASFAECVACVVFWHTVEEEAAYGRTPKNAFP